MSKYICNDIYICRESIYFYMKFNGVLFRICKYYISHFNSSIHIRVSRGPSVEMAMLPAPLLFRLLFRSRT